MVVKIFYFVLALFSVSFVFLIVETPYDLSYEKDDIKIAHTQVFDVKNIDANETSIFGEYFAKKVVRFDDRDEVEGFEAKYIDDMGLHVLSADKAIIVGKDITLSGNAHYRNLNQNIDYKSQSIVYSKKTLKSNTKFTLQTPTSKVTGVNLKYDLQNKTIKADKVKSWVVQK